MNGINCSVITQPIKELAKKLNVSDSYANNLVSVWQTENQTTEYPSVNDLEKLKKTLEKSIIEKNVLNVDTDSPRAKANRAFSASIRKDRESLLARQFSDMIDIMYEEQIDALTEELNRTDASNKSGISEINTRLNNLRDSENGRKYLVQLVTINKILDRIKEEWQSYLNQSPTELDAIYGEGQGNRMLNEYQKVLDHFDILMEDAATIIEKRESIRIFFEKHDYNTGNNTKEVFGGNIYNDVNIQEDTEDNNNDDAEHRSTNNDSIVYKVRFVDPHSTISKVVKKILSNIVKEDYYSGEPEYDDLGNVRYLDEENAHAILMSELSGMVVADDFSVIDNVGNIISLPALEKAAIKYPWINQIIQEIYADNNLASNFFVDFRKEFISYWAQKNGKTFMLNETTAVEDSKRETTYNYELGSQLDKNSVYNSDSSINKKNVDLGIEICDNTLDIIRDYYDEEDLNKIKNNVLKSLKMLGVNTNDTVITNVLNSDDGITNIEELVYSMKDIFSRIETMKEGDHLIEYFEDSYNNIFNIVGVVSETGGISSFRSGYKTFYSYSASNYLDGLIKSLKDDNKRQSYLDSQYKKYEWFFDKQENKWRGEWLRLIEEDREVVSMLKTIELNNIDDTYYTSWSPTQIKSAFIKQYYSAGYSAGSTNQFAWYNFPIFSDSPVVKFIKFIRYTEDYENTITRLLSEVVKQELWRIKHVQDRKNKGIPTISNYDSKGEKFHFLPELNNYTTSDNIPFISAVIEAKKEGDLNKVNRIIEDAVSDIMNYNFNIFLSNLSPLQVEKITEELIADGVIESEEGLDDALKEYFWNQTYATSQIIQLTTTDLAFYKDSIDFQKRYKEVYGAGTKLNTNSKYGKKTERTIYLSDQVITSYGFNNIKNILDKAVKDKKITKIDRDFIITKFNKVNITDAQAYRSLESFRSVLDMIGAWSTDMENAYNRIINEEWDISDFNIVWQTIKPFVYTQIEKPDGLGSTMKVPHQNKNSEFLLTAMYGMFSREMNKSPRLRALNKFMKEHNIDVVQFESAAKVGGQGIIDINISPSKLQSIISEYGSFKEYKKSLDTLLDRGEITQQEYNNIFEDLEPTEDEVYKMLTESAFDEEGNINPYVVHEIPYSDYVIQQPTPEHLFDAESIFGSQFRNLIISDISEDAIFTIDGKQYNKQQIRDLYQSIIVENLLDSYSKLKNDIKDIEGLQQLLLKQVKGNPKYGRDIVEALQIVYVVNPITGITEKTFNIPLSNPTITLRIQELINSLFKNRITKQHIKGGNAILVSNYGLSDSLNIIYDNKEGEATRIKGIECLLPASSKKLYEPLLETSEDGSYQYLDISKLSLDLRKIVGYRIPTEDKYSMVPLIVKGFLPQQNGSAIMLPADITTIAGSDFDVDKLFLMIPEFGIQKYDKKTALQDFYKEQKTNKEIVTVFNKSGIEEILESEETEDFREWFDRNKNKYLLDTPKVFKYKYDVSKNPQEQSLAHRNNMLIDIAHSILTNPDTANKFLNPGSFDKVKKADRIAIILGNRTIFEKFKSKFNLKDNEVGNFLLKSDLDILDGFVSDNRTLPNPLGLDNFVYFHNQNMTGGALIGAYANNTTIQAKYQGVPLAINNDNIFMVNGRVIKDLTKVISNIGERISKNCAEFSAASVDNGKDPVLANLMQNMRTARVTAFMLRSGMSIEEIGLLFTQPYVKEIINNGIGSFDSISDKIYEHIYSKIEILKDLGGSTSFDDFLTKDYSSKDLINNIISQYSEKNRLEEIEYIRNNIYSTLLFAHISDLAEGLQSISAISRADSPNAAVATSIAGAKNQVQRVKLVHHNAYKSTIDGIDNIINNEIINDDMSINEMRERLLKSKMPMLQTFYSLGIELATHATAPYFIQTSEYMNKLVELLYLNSPKGIISDVELNRFYSEAVTFGLTKTSIFGDSSEGSYEEKREYYLKEYPQKFLKVIANNPDISRLGIMKKINVKNNTIIMEKSARLSTTRRESFMRDFDSLLYSDNPEAHKLAIDLFAYSFYKDGFNFGPNNYGYFFSSFFVSSFPEFINTLRTMKYDMYKGSYFDRYLLQFYANNYNRGIIPTITGELNENGDLVTKTKGVLNKNIKGNFVWEYVVFNSKLYTVDKNQSNNNLTTYIEIPTKLTKTPIYNANKSLDELISNIKDEAGNEETNNPYEIPDYSSEEAIILNTLKQDEDVMSNTDWYSAFEGEGVLEEKLC